MDIVISSGIAAIGTIKGTFTLNYSRADTEPPN